MAVSLFLGTGTLLVGVEDDPGGLAVRVYVRHRAEGRYFLISDPDAIEAIRRGWAGHGHVVADIDDLCSLGVLLSERP